MPWSRLSPADEQLLFWFMVAIQVGSAFMTVRLWRGDQRALAIIRQSLRAAPRGLTEGMLQALPFGYCSLWLVTLLCASFVYEHELQRLGPLALLCRPEIRRVFFGLISICAPVYIAIVSFGRPRTLIPRSLMAPMESVRSGGSLG
jgi:hypothetical protein